MQINSLEISEHAHFVNVELTDLKDVVFIIGKNGAGKTRFMRSLYSLISGEKFNGRVTVGFTVKKSSSVVKQFKLTETEKINKIIYREMINCSEKAIFLEIPTILQMNLQANLQATEKEIESQKKDSKGRFDSRLINNLLGKAIVGYLRARSDSINEGKSLESIKSEIPTLEDRLNKALREIIPELQIKEPNSESQKLGCVIRDNVMIDPQFLSSGEFVLLILALEIISHNITKGIILIDEIEAHLHPDLQAKLLYFLKALIEPYQNEVQIWITTNSHILLDSSSLVNIDHSILHTTIATNNRISIQKVPHETLEYPIKLFQLLGSSPYYGRKKLLFVEGKTEKDILDTLFQHQVTLRGIWRIEPLNGSKAVINTLQLCQYLQDGPIEGLIPELSLIHGLVDNDDQLSIPDEIPKENLYQWPFYHIENLIFHSPWIENCFNSLSGVTGKNQGEIEDVLQQAVQNVIKNQQLKPEGSKGRVLSDKTLSNVIKGHFDPLKTLPGKMILKEWWQMLGISQKGGVDPVDLILSYIKTPDLKFPTELKNLINWLNQKKIFPSNL